MNLYLLLLLMTRSLELITRGCCSKLKSDLLEGPSQLGKIHTFKLLNQLGPHYFRVGILVGPTLFLFWGVGALLESPIPWARFLAMALRILLSIPAVMSTRRDSTRLFDDRRSLHEQVPQDVINQAPRLWKEHRRIYSSHFCIMKKSMWWTSS